MLELKNRLIEFARKQYDMGQTRFEEMCGINPGTISSIKVNGPSAANITKISIRCPELNLNWLFNGRGGMLNGDEQPGPSSSSNGMDEYARLDYLIKALSNDNARDFALKAGIRPDSLSRARNGKGNPSFYFERILSAFPGVERDWLYTGVGEPMKETKEKGEILRKIEGLEDEVKRLASLLESTASCPKSTNRG